MKRAANPSNRGCDLHYWGLVRLAAALFMLLLLAGHSRTQPQGPRPPIPVDPRPIEQLISQTEKNYLAEATNPKKLVDAYLKISDSHLQAAFTAIRFNDHRTAERELDVYNKAVAEAGKTGFKLQDGRRSVAKKIEQTLYRQIKTLESIERLFPGEREEFAEAALKHTKQVRVQALNEAFASGGVLKDPDEAKKPESEPPPKDEAPPKTPPPSTPLAIWSAPPARTLVSYYAGYRSSQIPGDYLTEEEDDHVREAQAADARAKVFMKIADRRMKAITGAADSPTDKKDQKKVEAEEREWGALPKVSRSELLRHYARAISECMAKLEDAYERNPKSSALPKALAILRDTTDKHLQVLRGLAAEMKSEAEIAALREAISEAETANKGARDGLK